MNAYLLSLKLSPVELIFATVLSLLAVKSLIGILLSISSYISEFRTNVKITIFKILIWLPCGRYFLQKEQAKTKKEFENRIKSKRKNQVYNLPEHAWKQETIMKRIKTGNDESRKYYTNGGKMSASVFCADDDHWDFISDVMRVTIESNPLWATEFASIA